MLRSLIWAVNSIPVARVGPVDAWCSAKNCSEIVQTAVKGRVLLLGHGAHAFEGETNKP
jgi:hypothetical protein